MRKLGVSDLKDILIRMGKTFLQGFLATLIILIKETDLTDENLLKSVLIGALAGGISAVMNLLLKAMEKKTPEEFEDAGDGEDYE